MIGDYAVSERRAREAAASQSTCPPKWIKPIFGEQFGEVLGSVSSGISCEPVHIGTVAANKDCQKNDDSMVANSSKFGNRSDGVQGTFR